VIALLSRKHVRDFNKLMGNRACIKVDLQEAFDSINRDFVLYIMHYMGFSTTWLNWIKECLESPTFSVPVNGYPIHYLLTVFVLVMEFWSIYMDLSLASGILSPSKRLELIRYLIFSLLMICCLL